MDLHWYNSLNEMFPDRDQDYIPIMGASWSDWSGYGWIVILEKDGQLYSLENGYSSMFEGSNELEWSPYPITYEQALEILQDWEEFID